jgi:hypothetical protein
VFAIGHHTTELKGSPVRRAPGVLPLTAAGCGVASPRTARQPA